jgi:hypothetical protein
MASFMGTPNSMIILYNTFPVIEIYEQLIHCSRVHKKFIHSPPARGVFQYQEHQKQRLKQG